MFVTWAWREARMTPSLIPAFFNESLWIKAPFKLFPSGGGIWKGIHSFQLPLLTQMRAFASALTLPRHTELFLLPLATHWVCSPNWTHLSSASLSPALRRKSRFRATCWNSVNNLTHFSLFKSICPFALQWIYTRGLPKACGKSKTYRNLP